VVPHRRSFWARAHASPFAEGRPYTISQLRSTLCGDLFTHVDDDYALFFPPSNRRFLLRLIPLFQWLGRLVPMTGGVILMEAEKQIYASITEPVKRKRPKRVFAPASKPVMGYD
ncbi:MAG: hypothetical protein CMM94_08025, partial [Rickettsiales bacterium]|nr:hypothetical protein [Rickettsiales bacterium]